MLFFLAILQFAMLEIAHSYSECSVQGMWMSDLQFASVWVTWCYTIRFKNGDDLMI